MKFVTFLNSHGAERVGMLVGDKIIDIENALQSDGRKIQLPSMNHLIEHYAEIESDLHRLQTQLPGDLVEAKNATLRSPIPRPLSMRDGYAFRQHVEAARRNRGLPMIPEFDLFPIFYYTNHLAVSGPGPVSVQKQAQEKLDFELEVAVVIGKRGRNIPASKADSHIFGYMIMNDWSARHLQMEEMKLNLGPAKGKDFSTTLGPWLVTRDELASRAIASPQGERHDLRMRAWVNDKLVSDGNVKDMTFSFAQIIERASYGVTLHPGEVIGSGTVGTGCFLELNGSKITDNQWLKPGDRVALEIDLLGRLENQIVAAEERYET